ncbi:uncharacterized protein LOC121645014 [Melanotaenia boesemani]|uniref:uncharacterized protein LOC121645014 n=1 Tax=Melanotaenia boesemani TaxID=1250792 RepID=UPI001C04A91F|nr:uncharacterized protein LOC121645014 [Melanotaenia boesemani]
METLAVICFFSALVGNSLEDDITPSRAEVFSSERQRETLSCNYSVAAQNLQWYRQDPGSGPQFLLLITDSTSPTVVKAEPPYPGLTVELKRDRKQVDLVISSAAVSDSAVYYCAVRPTVFILWKRAKGSTTEYIPEFNKQLFVESGLSRLLRPDSTTMVDRGFLIDSCVPCKVQRPAFLSGRPRMPENEVEEEQAVQQRSCLVSFCCRGRTLFICCLTSTRENMLLYLLLLFSHYVAMGSMNIIKQQSSEEVVAEGRNINVSCEYEGSIYNIQWYRQQQRSRPEFLLYITEEGFIHPPGSDFSAHINKTQKHVDLEISSAAVTDSAVYYCALQPTVTGNSKTLYKNLWSKDNAILHNVH